MQGSRSSVVRMPTEALGSISSGCPGIFLSVCSQYRYENDHEKMTCFRNCSSLRLSCLRVSYGGGISQVSHKLNPGVGEILVYLPPGPRHPCTRIS